MIPSGYQHPNWFGVG